MDKNISEIEIDKVVIEVCENIAAKTSCEKHKFSKDTKLDKDNGIDSLALMNIFIDIEERLGLSVDDKINELAHAKSIGELIEILKLIKM